MDSSQKRKIMEPGTDISKKQKKVFQMKMIVKKQNCVTTASIGASLHRKKSQ